MVDQVQLVEETVPLKALVISIIRDQIINKESLSFIEMIVNLRHS